MAQNEEYIDLFVPYDRRESITQTSISKEEYIKRTQFAQKTTEEDIKELMTKRYGEHFTKDPTSYNKDRLKLKINKRLPKIKLPASKLKLFADWWNEDIRYEKTIPHSFEEGYLFIENEHGQDINKYSALIKHTAKMYKTTYRNIEKQMKEFLDNMKEITLYFKFIDKNKVFAELYDAKNLILSDIKFEFGPEKESPESRITLYDTTDFIPTYTDINDVLDNFNVQFVYYLWYMATAASNTRYIYEEKIPTIEHRHKHTVHVSDTKFIVTPVYDLSKVRTTTVEKLVTRKNGWTYSHSFQVHGHYRHYKNGKTIFIESYIKGKGKPFKAQTTILAPEKIKEVT